MRCFRILLVVVFSFYPFFAHSQDSPNASYSEADNLRALIGDLVLLGKNGTVCGVNRVEDNIYEGEHGCPANTPTLNPLSAAQGICAIPPVVSHHKIYKNTSPKYCPGWHEGGWPSRHCNRGGKLLPGWYETKRGSRSCSNFKKQRVVHVTCGTQVRPLNNECHHLGFGIDEEALRYQNDGKWDSPAEIAAAAKLLEIYEKEIRTNDAVRTIAKDENGEDIIISMATYTTRDHNDPKLALDDIMYRSLLYSVGQDNFIDACKKTVKYISSLPDDAVLFPAHFGIVLKSNGFTISK